MPVLRRSAAGEGGGSASLACHHACIYFPGVPGRFPRGLFARKMRRQRQAKIYFLRWEFVGATSAQLLLHHRHQQPPSPGLPTRRCPRLGRGPEPAPASPLPRPAPGSPVPRGKKATERNFPLYDCVTFGRTCNENPRKMLHNTRIPFWSKVSRKAWPLPRGGGRCWGRRYLPGSTSASSAVPLAASPLPGPAAAET